MYLEILPWCESKDSRLRDMKEIFLLSAPTTIQAADENRKESFWNTWTSFYINNYPEELFFACDEKTKQTLGYLSGCSDSQAASVELGRSIKSYDVFRDLFKKFPAHFHINVHPSARAQGVGTFLVQEYLLELKKMRVHGAHIVTDPDARNVDFYLRNKFNSIAKRPFGEKQLLFMGQTF